MDASSLVHVLGKLRFSESLSAAALERIAAMATLRGFPAGTVLFREGAKNVELMIVTVGRVALEMRVPGRGDVRIISLGPGDIVAWSALLGDGRMTTSAVALEDTQVVCLPAALVAALCQDEPAIGYDLMHKLAHALADRLVATRLQLLDLFADADVVMPLGPD